MNIEINTGALRGVHFYDYAARFVFGGIITALTGLIARRYGPAVAGLFLAFPAILPATASLIEKHETKKMHDAGLHGKVRGRTIASVDAAGASMGSIGLIAFGLITWQLLPRISAVLTLGLAAAVWFGVAFGIWWIRKLM